MRFTHRRLIPAKEENGASTISQVKEVDSALAMKRKKTTKKSTTRKPARKTAKRTSKRKTTRR